MYFDTGELRVSTLLIFLEESPECFRQGLVSFFLLPSQAGPFSILPMNIKGLFARNKLRRKSAFFQPCSHTPLNSFRVPMFRDNYGWNQQFL